MAKTAYIKENGAWHKIHRTYVKNGGTWLPLGATYKKANGAWSKVENADIFDEKALITYGGRAPWFGVSSFRSLYQVKPLLN